MQDATMMVERIEVVEEMPDGAPSLSIFQPSDEPQPNPESVAPTRAEQVAMSRFREELESLAAKYILRFFDGKKRKDGVTTFDTEVDYDVLATKDNIDLVLNSEMCEGIDHFYKITSEGEKGFTAKQKRAASDANIRYLTAILGDAASLGVPKPLIAGIACVHAKLVGYWETPFDPDEVLEDEKDDCLEPDDLELDIIEFEMADEEPSFMGFALGFGGHNW